MNGDAPADDDEQNEVGQLKKRYTTELASLKELFPHMPADDLLFELRECGGDLPATADKLTEGPSLPLSPSLILSPHCPSLSSLNERIKTPFVFCF